jgi:hypothetical protein
LRALRIERSVLACAPTETEAAASLLRPDVHDSLEEAVMTLPTQAGVTSPASGTAAGARPSARTGSRGQRLTALAGLGFAVTYFIYMVQLVPPDISTPNDEVLQFWGDSGNRTEAVLLATACGVAVLLFVVFVVGLARRLDDAGAVHPAHGVRLAGGVTATFLLLGGAVFASPALALTLNNEAVPLNDDLALAIRTSSFVAHPVMLWFTGSAGAVLVTMATAGRRALGWRRWTTVLGAVLVAAMLAPLVFFSLALLLLWVAVVSVWMLRDPGRWSAVPHE